MTIGSVISGFFVIKPQEGALRHLKHWSGFFGTAFELGRDKYRKSALSEGF